MAVVRPQAYRRFQKKQALVAVVVIWIWGFILNTLEFLTTKADLANQKCSFFSLKTAIGKIILSLLQISFTCLLPFPAIISLYIHTYFLQNQSNAIVLTRSSWNRGEEKANSTCPCGVINPDYCSVNPVLYGVFSSSCRMEYISVLSGILPCFPCRNKKLVAPTRNKKTYKVPYSLIGRAAFKVEYISYIQPCILYLCFKDL